MYRFSNVRFRNCHMCRANKPMQSIGVKQYCSLIRFLRFIIMYTERRLLVTVSNSTHPGCACLIIHEISRALYKNDVSLENAKFYRLAQPFIVYDDVQGDVYFEGLLKNAQLFECILHHPRHIHYYFRRLSSKTQLVTEPTRNFFFFSQPAA